MNQFAIDKRRLHAQMLSPLSVRELLAGKAVGNGLIGGHPGGLLLLVSGADVSRAAAPALWLGLLCSASSPPTCSSRPAAAALSAIFPKSVDLNSIGNGSNAHQGAGLLGMLAFAAAGAPPALSRSSR